MMNTSKGLILVNQTKLSDEENGMYVGVPIVPNGDIMHAETAESQFLWACYLLSSIQIIVFTMMTSIYGFAPHHANSFYGPPIEVIDAWGSKNPYRIVNGAEYWRVITAIFLSVGLMDLVFSVIILFCLGYHLEQRWGSLKLVLVYLLSGIGGNIFGTLTSPEAISVGSGGCIFGLVGAMHVEMIHSIIHQHFNNSNNKKSDEDVIEQFTRNNENEVKPQYNYIFPSALIVLGFLGGVLLTTFIGVISPDSPRKQKDWNVLYGGMTSGMVVSLVWHLYVSLMKKGNSSRDFRVAYGLVFLVVPFLLDCFLSVQISQTISQTHKM